MRKNKDIFVQEFRSRPITYILQVVGVVVILLNMWLAGKLVPLAKDLDSLVIRVKASEIQINEIKIKDDEVDKQMLIQTTLNGVKLDNLRDQITTLDTRLSKHLGI